MRTVLVLAAAATLWGCCGPNQCTAPDGTACHSNTDCHGSCVDAVCREACAPAVGCAAERSCYLEPGSDMGVCLPPALPDELWRVSLDGVERATGSPFVCLAFPSVTLCSEQETGATVSFTRPFTTVFTTAQLAGPTLSVFGSQETTPFAGCEGSCSILERVHRTASYSEVIDARPVASRKRQVWSFTAQTGLVVHLTVNP